jgi:hypothetical protein
MNRYRSIAVVLAAIGLQACDSPSEPAPGVAFEVIPEVVAVGNWGGSANQMLEVVKDRARWEAVWGMIGRQTPAPEIDFERSMVVFAALEAKGSGGYEVEVSRILPMPSELRIEILVTNPGGICPVHMMENWPVQAVVTERLDQPVIFTLTQVKRSC